MATGQVEPSVFRERQQIARDREGFRRRPGDHDLGHIGPLAGHRVARRDRLDREA